MFGITAEYFKLSLNMRMNMMALKSQMISSGSENSAASIYYSKGNLPQSQLDFSINIGVASTA